VQKVVPSYEVERTDFTLSWTLPTDLGGTALGARESVAAGQTFNYRLQMPTVSSIETVFDAGGRRVTAQIVAPVSADGLTARQFWLVGIDSTVSGEHGVSIDEMYDFEAKIFAEDVHIVEKQVPREAPLDGAMQVHSRADKYSLVFRRAYKELMAKATS
jgi:Vanillate O-demethylase oxygenase C-terminal domain